MIDRTIQLAGDQRSDLDLDVPHAHVLDLLSAAAVSIDADGLEGRPRRARACLHAHALPSARAVGRYAALRVGGERWTETDAADANNTQASVNT